MQMIMRLEMVRVEDEKREVVRRSGQRESGTKKEEGVLQTLLVQGQLQELGKVKIELVMEIYMSRLHPIENMYSQAEHKEENNEVNAETFDDCEDQTGSHSVSEICSLILTFNGRK